MPLDPVLASVHFKVAQAGASVEAAIQYLSARRIFQGRMAVNQAAGLLSSAASLVRQQGSQPALLNLLTQLAAWYQGQAQKIIRPASAPEIAAALQGAQGTLLAADPYGPAPTGT